MVDSSLRLLRREDLMWLWLCHCQDLVLPFPTTDLWSLDCGRGIATNQEGISACCTSGLP